jgi:hypothetical protein
MTIKLLRHSNIARNPWKQDRAVCDDNQGNHNDCLKIISDPDDCGGFSPGALISRFSARQMLLQKYFTVGTEINFPGHGVMEVVEYTTLISHGNGGVIIKHIQAFKGSSYYLLPSLDSGSVRFVRVGLNGQTRIRAK